MDVSWELSGNTVPTPRPGATTSSAFPVEEKDARASLWSVAPTEIVKGEAPGPERSAAPIPKFPAAAMRIAPASRANWRAAFNVAEPVGWLTKLMLMTCAPWFGKYQAIDESRCGSGILSIQHLDGENFDTMVDPRDGKAVIGICRKYASHEDAMWLIGRRIGIIIDEIKAWEDPALEFRMVGINSRIEDCNHLYQYCPA
jgi:hypothetical protein